MLCYTRRIERVIVFNFQDRLYSMPVIFKTADGSDTLIDDRTGATYHSKFGAFTESQHIYIRHGWQAVYPLNSPVYVFEMGFGTGLNALLTAREAIRLQHPTFYISIDNNPVDPDLLESLNYPYITGDIDLRQLYQSITESPWNDPVRINPWFTLFKIQANLEDFNPSVQVHLIYYDAFAPDINQGLYSTSMLKKMYDMTIPGGRWVSYVSKGMVRRNLVAAGWKVWRKEGPPGKRHITIAVKSLHSIPEN